MVTPWERVDVRRVYVRVLPDEVRLPDGLGPEDRSRVSFGCAMTLEDSEVSTLTPIRTA